MENSVEIMQLCSTSEAISPANSWAKKYPKHTDELRISASNCIIKYSLNAGVFY
jgi:hypothetical protein